MEITNERSMCPQCGHQSLKQITYQYGTFGNIEQRISCSECDFKDREIIQYGDPTDMATMNIISEEKM